MASCGFEEDLGNGLKAGIIGVALGGLGWLIWGAAKGKSSQPYERPRDRPRERPSKDRKGKGKT